MNFTKLFLLTPFVILSACVGVHPQPISTLFQCGEPPSPFVNARGQVATRISNLAISRVGGISSSTRNNIRVNYEGFDSAATILVDSNELFEYQFRGGDGELIQINGNKIEQSVNLDFLTRENHSLECVAIQ